MSKPRFLWGHIWALAACAKMPSGRPAMEILLGSHGTYLGWKKHTFWRFHWQVHLSSCDTVYTCIYMYIRNVNTKTLNVRFTSQFWVSQYPSCFFSVNAGHFTVSYWLQENKKNVLCLALLNVWIWFIPALGDVPQQAATEYEVGGQQVPTFAV